MPTTETRAGRPVMPCKCGPTTSNDPNVRGLYCWDGQFYRYIRDIPKSECPLFPIKAVTASVVASYVRHNALPPAELPSLLKNVHSSLANLVAGPEEPATTEKPNPAVPVKKSITPDYIFSLEDGKPYKSLKRHLSGRGMTPADYRAKWGLASDYPMVAANHAKARSELAKSSGLGQRRKAGPAAGPAPSANNERGRKKAK